MAEERQVTAACERLRPHAEVRRVAFDEALAVARRLLRLEEDCPVVSPLGFEPRTY